MTDVIEEKILMVGLPETGKSTFLAAFWQLVETQVPSEMVQGSLKLHGILPDERGYLNAIKEDWLRSSPISRNLNAEIQDAYMKLSDGNGKIIDLYFPDILGESYSKIVEMRTWTKEFDKLIREVTRIVLFIHPKISAGKPTIHAVSSIMKESGIENENTIQHSIPEEANFQSTVKAQAKPWNTSEHVPRQVKYIDLIQLLLGPYAGKPIKKISLVISAWDTCKNENITPEKWLEKHAPMLFQFLTARSTDFDLRIFGISAQGGNYSNQSERDKVLDKELSERTEIAGTDPSVVNIHDITYPVRWLFD